LLDDDIPTGEVDEEGVVANVDTEEMNVVDPVVEGLVVFIVPARQVCLYIVCTVHKVGKCDDIMDLDNHHSKYTPDTEEQKGAHRVGIPIFAPVPSKKANCVNEEIANDQ
jgi:hypothetical protein